MLKTKVFIIIKVHFSCLSQIAWLKFFPKYFLTFMFRFYVLLVLIIKDVINYKIILSIKTYCEQIAYLWWKMSFLIKSNL